MNSKSQISESSLRQKCLPVMYWGRVWAQTDLGGWSRTNVRPTWYWRLRRLGLALRLWRVRYEPVCDPFGWREAWDIAAVAEGFSRVPYHRSGFPSQRTRR